jgi:hypothetical protein
VSAETNAGFLGNTVGIGVEGLKKLLDLFRSLLIAQRLALTWLDVMMHLRLHPAHPKYLLSSSEAATLWLKLTRAGEESFCLSKLVVHYISTRFTGVYLCAPLGAMEVRSSSARIPLLAR